MLLQHFDWDLTRVTFLYFAQPSLNLERPALKMHILWCLGRSVNFNITSRFLSRRPMFPDYLSVSCDYNIIYGACFLLWKCKFSFRYESSSQSVNHSILIIKIPAMFFRKLTSWERVHVNPNSVLFLVNYLLKKSALSILILWRVTFFLYFL